MFSSDNFELDFDDDFSSNIFSKRLPSSEGTGERDRLCHQIKPQPNIFKRGLTESPGQPVQDKSTPPSKGGSSHVLSSPPSQEPRQSTFKRPHLQDDKPQKKRLSHQNLLPRKFPGPAGLLPDKPFKQVSHLPLPPHRSSPEEDTTADKDHPIIYSQSSGSVFLDSPYQKLLTDFTLTDSSNPLNKYTLEWVKKTALSKGLQGRKIPFLGLVVHAVNHSMPDPVLMLRDPTGEISGSLHREVWAQMGGKLRPGIAVALRQVGVLITGVIRRQIYLNITMNNILAVYGPSENEKEVETTAVNELGQSELLSWLATSRSAPPRPDIGVQEEVVSELMMELRDADFGEEMSVGESVKGAGSSGALSPSESLMVEEVLSGIDLDEFDM